MTEAADVVEIERVRERAVRHRGFDRIGAHAEADHARLRMTADEFEVIADDRGEPR